MRCPRCREWIDLEQTTHAKCGWNASSVVEPNSPEAWHAKQDAGRATPEQVDAHMAKIMATLAKKRSARRLSSQEQHEGGKLSGEEKSLMKTQEQYDEEVKRLRAEDLARAARRERLRKAVA